MRNIRVGRPISQCKLTDSSRLVLLVNLQTSCVVKILDSKTQTDLGGFHIERTPNNRYDFRVSNRFVFAHNRDLGVVDLYSLDARAKAQSLNVKPFCAANPSAFAVSDDGKHFAVGDRRGVFTIWSIKSANPKATAKGFDPIALIEFSADAQKTAIAFENGDIAIVKADNLDDRSLLKLHKSNVSALKFIANRLISADLDGRLAAWNAENGKLERVYTIGKGAIRGVDRAFDDRAAIVVTEGGALALTDINRDRKALEADALGEALALVTFDDKTQLCVVVTSSWNLLFFNLQADKAIETFLTPPNDDESLARSDAIKVIVVDDSITMRRVIQAALKADFPLLEVIEANDGKEALELLEQNPDVKIMFLDWNMPTMSGAETTAKIKEAKIYPNLQIIMATTEGGHEKVMQMLRMGVAGYLVKPFRRDAITKITRKLLERIAL
jgi:two-component system chemotaxis response regulator CheY